MNTLCEAVCQRSGIAPGAFPSWMLLRSVYPHAIPLTWLLERLHRDSFYADFELIRRAGQASELKKIWSEVESFRTDPVNDSWLRRVLKIRISSRRFYRLAQDFLPKTGSTPPFSETRPPM